MPKETILVADDAERARESIAEILRSQGYEVHTAADGQKAMEAIDRQYYDVALIDLNMPKANGLTVLKHLSEQAPNSLGIIITGFGSIETAVEAIKAGGFDYLTKPVKVEEIGIVLKRALEYRDLKRENLMLKRQVRRKYRFANFIGDSQPMNEVFSVIEKVADTDSTVLIYGESGTGKELVARAIHYHSSRRERPLIPVNCGAIPEELLESELFGHEKGAFTNAIRTRIGRFEMANGGTIFLDEIGEMSPGLQVKLLRLLQEKRFERLGGTKTLECDVRIVAATNKDLEKEVKGGGFREDLFYRLNVIPIRVPPLRTRTSDIPLLVHHFLENFSKTKKKPPKNLNPEAMEALHTYHWPGNVRELENLMERLVILTEGPSITLADLPEEVAGSRSERITPPLDVSKEGFCLADAVERFERDLIMQALDKTDWVKNQAAKLLNMNRTTLVEKMKRQKIHRGDSTA
jgi:DNA-binding NtrC family response regulator